VRLNRKVAIKVMLPELAFHDGMEDRFKREARMAAKLDHPNIVVIHSVRDDAEVLYFVMKFIEGASLEQVARKYAPLPIPIIQHLLLQLGGALQYAHDEGVVHRDVKPPNVLIDRRGNALVTDFGIAKAADVPALTRTGSVIGTPAYMSPEQVTGDELTASSDQYSLGVVAYELLTGQPPFVGGLMELQWAHVKTEPASLLTLLPDCPPALAAAVMRMLAKAPADRFPSLAHALPSFAEGLVRGDESPRIELAELVRAISLSQTDGIPNTPASPIPRGRGGPTTPWTSIQVSPPQAQLQIGEHAELTVTFLPAPENHGIVFVRSDLPGRPRVHVRPENAMYDPKAGRRTILAEGGVQVHTMEHVLATVSGLGIDNVVIETSTMEIIEPEDGSALAFAQQLQEASIVDQKAGRRHLKISRPVSLREGPIELTAVPSDRFRITFTIDYDHPAVGAQISWARIIGRVETEHAAHNNVPDSRPPRPAWRAFATPPGCRGTCPWPRYASLSPPETPPDPLERFLPWPHRAPS